MARLRLLFVVAVFAFATCGSCGSEFEEATIDSIRLGFKNGSLTSTALVCFYLDQICRLNPLLHAVIEVNPDALRQAVSADAERASGHRRAAAGLHGVPVLIKDLIATRDRKNTTAGSLALLGSVVSRDAGVVSRLRRAGTVVLGKANLPEWANFRSGRSMGGLHGWSARGGQSRVSTSDCESATTMFFL
jgi:amidase